MKIDCYDKIESIQNPTQDNKKACKIFIFKKIFKNKNST